MFRLSLIHKIKDIAQSVRHYTVGKRLIMIFFAQKIKKIIYIIKYSHKAAGILWNQYNDAHQ
jgi:hypothetical protein